MEITSKKYMYETDVTFLEDKTVSATFSWLALNLDVPWNDAPEKPGKSTALGKIICPLFGSGKYHTVRLHELGPGAKSVTGSGELLPLYPCVGCSVSDGESTHALNFGKKLHLPADKRRHTIYIAGNTMLYVLWLFRTEEDLAQLPKKDSRDNKKVKLSVK
ncbi:hypothetical protein GGI43DRAFT_410951 [Trichoderma evansii]